MTETAEPFTQAVCARPDHYAGRGVFRVYARVRDSRSGNRAGRVVTRLMDRRFEITTDGNRQPATGNRQTITLKNILPAVERNGALDKNLRAFVAGQIGDTVLAHRRTAESVAGVPITNRKGSVSITLKTETETGAETQTNRAILLGHQIYTVFLREGGYDDYLMQALVVDLDAYA
ncbi:MAG: hypothetical protein QF921_11640 [Pseudomonadales bacterium]|jgi:hypothetical protein|nr:hypothetical protein [Pseudomonadales bacterium]MDP6470740.1 hypothetical protein [Pseudomonadales bacterium]MDP6828308.1 hypothetical protein [Pseudomonadales bacterium]MDP6972142.1 hypothetical protein [Pseudomonadales bacterium]|tara:strand:- start:321 stop:848 length:528 start_codon:yes stop_codon:yes gene_type:complete